MATAAELRTLDVHGCWQRLGRGGIGRVAVALLDGTILVLPVNYDVDEHVIVFRTAPGAALDHLHRGPVTFQVDSADPFHRTGWSVLVHGWASVEGERADHDRPPEPWAGSHRRHVVRIRADRVTGREIVAAQPDWDPRGYL